MSLGIFFPIGDSLEGLKSQEKLARLVDYYLPAYKKKFSKIYIFSYGVDENFVLPDGCVLIGNKWKFHRFFYAFLIPIIHFRVLAKIKVLRILQLSGIFPALITKLFFGTKLAITYGYDYREVERLTGHRFKPYLYLFIERLLLPACDTVIFSSRAIQSSFLNLLHKSVHIPNGIDLGKFTPGHKSKLSNQFSVLSQGRLSPEKNLGFLIEAVSFLPKRKTVLTIIGTGPQKYELEQAAKRFGVDLSIIEKVPNNQMPDYYRQSDIYIHPSLTEGSPKSLIEAAACECSILATDIMQNREILGDKGAIYFRPDLNDLKTKLTSLHDNRQKRIILGKNARVKVQKHFDINKLLVNETGMLFSLAKQ